MFNLHQPQVPIRKTDHSISLAGSPCKIPSERSKPSASPTAGAGQDFVCSPPCVIFLRKDPKDSPGFEYVFPSRPDGVLTESPTAKAKVSSVKERLGYDP